MIFAKNYWKKIIMATFAFFWSGCDSDSPTQTTPDCDSCECNDKCENLKSSSSKKQIKQSSSSEEFTRPVALYGVSSDIIDMPIALYGPPCVLNGTPCYDDDVDGPIVSCYELDNNDEATAIECDDGQKFEKKEDFMSAVLDQRTTNPNFAQNCKESELCDDKIDPETQTVAHECKREISCPEKPKEEE